MNSLQSYILVTLFSYGLTTHVLISNAVKESEIVDYELVPVIQDLEMQSFLSKCRLIALPVVMLITMHYNYEKLTKNVKDYPFFFLLGFYCFANYIIDSIVKYRQINQTLQFFLYSKMMSRQLLSLFAIKNQMKKLCALKKVSFNELEFLSLVNKHAGRALEELEIFTFELLKSSTYSISNLCIDVNISDIEEKMYLLFKDTITIQEMLLICEHDELLYEQLMNFSNNSEFEYQEVVENISIMLAKNFNYFLEKRLYIQKVCV